MGTPPFSLFLQPDLALSVAAPFNAAVGQQVFGHQRTVHKVWCMNSKNEIRIMRKICFLQFPQLHVSFVG